MAMKIVSCEECPQTFVSFGERGPLPKKCPKCKKKHVKKQTRKRVRNLREKRIRVTKANKRFIVHIHRFDSGKTYCGAQQDLKLVERILFGSEPCDHRYCRTCAMMHKKATGVELAQ